MSFLTLVLNFLDTPQTQHLPSTGQMEDVAMQTYPMAY